MTSEWQGRRHVCPQFRRLSHCSWQPPSGLSLAKSSAVCTTSGVSRWRGQTSSKPGPKQLESLRIWIVLFHMGTNSDVAALPMMYIPCRARDSSTLILLDVLRNPHLRCGLERTREITITSASSPWKLSTVATLNALSREDFTAPPVGRSGPRGFI